MPGPERTKVFHIPGRLVPGEPQEDTTVESKTEADRLVATGAFAHTQKEANELAFTSPAATPIDEEPAPSAPAEAEES